MSAMPASNRPRYAPIAPDSSARAHLLVADQTAIAATVFTAGIGLADFPERWSIVAHAHALPEPLPGAGHKHFRSAAHLLAMLRHRLATETMGLRLYVTGCEPFVWDVANLAREAGMGRDEMQLYATGASVRRVSCVHCRHINPDVTATLVTCAGCGATLGVRDHFSRAHNAWMGVQVDAEAPGELPVAEDLSGWERSA
ncbi:dimethylamine monooxygenase subunit DmmA family protein [Novosphingobium sp.]|uniref:dimethylamine monooxygenase subunit DmmA family protein n=1 Tax=Novosphingobium sp. TaxID=1874826 RepID=UPI003B515792